MVYINELLTFILETKFFQILVGAFLLAVDIISLNILDLNNIQSNYIESLSSSRLS